MIFKMNNKKAIEQNAVVFITYMIGSSYFNVNTTCNSTILEKRLELYYKELPSKKQFLFENICDNYMQKLLKEIPSCMWDMRAGVDFKIKPLSEEKLFFEIIFDTWKFAFSLCGICDNKGQIKYSHKILPYTV